MTSTTVRARDLFHRRASAVVSSTTTTPLHNGNIATMAQQSAMT
jgi:hypothetical protein